MTSCRRASARKGGSLGRVGESFRGGVEGCEEDDEEVDKGSNIRISPEGFFSISVEGMGAVPVVADREKEIGFRGVDMGDAAGNPNGRSGTREGGPVSSGFWLDLRGAGLFGRVGAVCDDEEESRE